MDRLQELRVKLDDVRQEIVNESRGRARKRILNASLKVEAGYWTEFQYLQKGPVWMQVDGERLVEPDRQHLYASAILVNENVDPPRQCEMRLMIDTGCGEELIIPRRKAQQLHLVQFDERAAEGHGGRVHKTIVYRVVFVKLFSTASDGSQEVFKQADLTAISCDEAVDREDNEEDLCNYARCRLVWKEVHCN
ncbi:g9386 [Coccomyxa elongata]